jgi:hypothetical protein
MTWWKRLLQTIPYPDDSFGGLIGIQQFRLGYLLNPNNDQREFDRQLAKMNPDLDISVPVRISQALADEPVRYEIPATPLTPEVPGTKALIEELKEPRESTADNDIVDRIYSEDEVTDDEPLKAHFTTINADT